RFFKTKIFYKRFSAHTKILAFTLAEVLITLAIIGVVAAMTIPALLRHTENQEFISAYKKMFSTINDVYTQIKYENGDTLEGVFPSHDDYLTIFSNYLSKSKICTSGTTAKNCWHEKWYGLDNSTLTSTENSFPSLILNDGSIILFWNMSSKCTGTTELKTATGCARLRTDINGFKGPNKIGRDIFDFYILQDKVIARGDPLSSTSMNDKQGWGKGYKILTTGKLD
ncbi:MAG: type II secretion system GspH family protein, partial [Candidatus Gastranaerophilales bacterium]|nr:type II secretion system GspH family protein [Candidatus Gastranaerophilales bacterium]